MVAAEVVVRHRKPSRRGEVERKLAALEAIAEGKTKITHITGSANLNAMEVKEYLVFFAGRRYIMLVSDGLRIEGKGGGPLRVKNHSKLKIAITQDGIRILNQAKTIRRLFTEEP